MKARQGRLAEAEADARTALLSRLKDQGKYNPPTPRFIMGLADVLVEQGRYAEAEKLARVSLEINREVGIAERCSYQRATAFQSRRNAEPAAQVRGGAGGYGELDKAIAKWEPTAGRCSSSTARASIRCTPPARSRPGIAAAQALLKREIGRVGEKHFDTATARGTLAIGLMRAGKDADAAREFQAAIPVLMAAARENADDDDTTVVAAKSSRLQDIVEAYIALLAGSATAATSRPKPSSLRTRSAAGRCSRRWRPRARACWQRIRRWPSSSARSRIW